jgi:hypothetical protein
MAITGPGIAPGHPLKRISRNLCIDQDLGASSIRHRDALCQHLRNTPGDKRYEPLTPGDRFPLARRKEFVLAQVTPVVRCLSPLEAMTSPGIAPGWELLLTWPGVDARVSVLHQQSGVWSDATRPIPGP